MVTPKAAPQRQPWVLTSKGSPSHIRGFPHPRVLSSCPIPAKETFQQLFQAPLASCQAGRFSKQIYQPPHQNCLLLQPPQQSTFYLILCCCLLQLRVGFFLVLLSFLAYQNLTFLWLCWKVLYLILVFHVFHFSRILAVCNWGITSFRIIKEVTPYLCFRNWWRRKRGGGGYSQAFKSAQWA